MKIKTLELLRRHYLGLAADIEKIIKENKEEELKKAQQTIKKTESVG